MNGFSGIRWRKKFSEQGIDLIDLPTARLTMRAVVAEEDISFKGDATAWLGISYSNGPGGSWKSSIGRGSMARLI